MSLLVIKQGLLDTVQDAGLYHYQHLGINPGGAMDFISMRVANALVGNANNEAVLEMHFPAATLQFEQDCLIALAGADLTPTIDGTNIAMLKPILVKKDSVLQFKAKQTGARTYLAVRKGMKTDEWLGSYSTHLKARTGGMQGRALKKGDRILIKAQEKLPDSKINWIADTNDCYRSDSFRFVTGHEYEMLDDKSKEQLTKQVFSVTPQSDRMGYRLASAPLQLKQDTELISTAVTKGTMQLLPDGQVIILMADHQTTGGYPRIGHVISADLSSLAQMSAGEKFTMQRTDIGAAEQAFLQQQSNLQQLENACTFRLQQYFNQL